MRVPAVIIAGLISIAVTRSALATPKATFLPQSCLLSIEVDGRVVYRGKPRCKNKPTAVEVPVPPARAVRVRTRSASFYANGGIWAVHDDELLMPIAAQRYTIGEGYALFEGGTSPSMQGTHCVKFTSANPRYTSWLAWHFADRDGPFAMGDSHAIGHDLNERGVVVLDDKPARDDRRAHYVRLVPGTYQFHVDRRGRISLSYDPVDRCAQ
jgi:hypothetical protein